ncbi:UNVERIFIED_CONTAM: hypothetical protein RMT77_015403 [Armadillidium vulgare]
MEIEVITFKENEVFKIILNECSHTKKQCLENRNFTHHKVRVSLDTTFVAIGFRNDKKINFAASTGIDDIATNLFGPDNEYKLKMDGFYFNTNETMNITFSSSLEEDNEYDALPIALPKSVGGYSFDGNGYLLHDSFWCAYYINPEEGDGLPYIIKEYLKNSENWRAPPVKWTTDFMIPYFNENGMV